MILVVAATERELDFLDGAATLVCGIGPVEAALATARALPEAHVLPIGTTARVGGGASCDVEAREGFGVLRAAALANVPAVELRAVSNLVAERDRARWSIREALAGLADAVPRLLAELDSR
jgi:nucleoside phosphorylase